MVISSWSVRGRLQAQLGPRGPGQEGPGWILGQLPSAWPALLPCAPSWAKSKFWHRPYPVLDAWRATKGRDSEKGLTCAFRSGKASGQQAGGRS